MRQFIIIFTSFFYTGYFPKGSGTFATAVFLPFYYFLFRTMDPWLYGSITAVLYLLGVWASNYAAVIHNDEDPSKVVIDEVTGFLITMFLIPFTWKRLIAGFFVARILDIIKPFPAYQAQSLKGGNGIMLDDAVSGVQGWILMWVLIYFKII
ncbi:MAG: phosphatidylglycerophosphatase A [Spirochaetia bacterium]|nr:phosphatidylglycerophosphatase A [Spirochaetia bacterium]